MGKYENIIKISIIVLVIVIISVLLIKRFIYFKPTSEFLLYKEHYQDISEGNIHGWLIKGTNNKVVLICHGNSGNISHRQNIIDSLNNLGYSVIIFDYSGYGKSIGVPSETQLYQDASVFVNIALRQYQKQNIILYGESIGAPVASYIAIKYQLTTLIIDSGLPSIKKYIKRHYKIFSFFSVLFPEFNTEKYLQGYKGKLLVMHSLNDEIIPFDITEIIRKYANKIIHIQGTHNTRKIPWDEVHKFIQET